jgi:ABC-type Mn2+/Zn2+ transport system permease subunit
MRPLRYFWLWLAGGWLAVLLTIYLSLISKPLVELTFDYGDKLGHFLVYGVLMGWFVQLYQSRPLLIAHALFLIALGVGLEFLQQYSGRYFDIADMVANSGGVGLALLLLFTPGQALLLRLERRLFPHS